MREIPVYVNGELEGYAQVDDEDFDLLSRFHWYGHEARDKIYATTIISRSNIPMHQLVFGSVVPHYHVDHIDRNTLNNQKENLRQVLSGDNLKNRGMTKKNTSGYKGARWDNHHNSWVAMISSNRLKVGLGSWPSGKEAALAYDHACRLLHGEYACLNFPDEMINELGAKRVENYIQRASVLKEGKVVLK